MKTNNLIYFFIFLLLITSVSAQLKLPPSMQKINEYNNEYFSDFSIKVTFFIAFLAGILSILSPCILPLLPAYFSYTFKEKKNITFMTLIFFLGFSFMFVILGILSGLLGQQTLNMVQSESFIRIAALFIFGFGMLSFFGKNFTLIKLNHTTKNDPLGVFLFGVMFAISWTGCLGPVLSGILGIGAILGNFAQAGLLLFFYSLGTFVPLFILSVFYDKYNLKKYVKGRAIPVKIFGKPYELNSINVLSGLLLMGSAVFLFVYGGTKLFNSIDPLSTKLLFYEYQNKILQWTNSNLLSIIVFLIFIFIIAYSLIKQNKNMPKKEVIEK